MTAFIHSYVEFCQSPANRDWQLATCNHGGEFIAAVKKGNVHAVQFHPEKSGGILQQLWTIISNQFHASAVVAYFLWWFLMISCSCRNGYTSTVFGRRPISYRGGM